MLTDNTLIIFGGNDKVGSLIDIRIFDQSVKVGIRSNKL